MRRAVRGSFRQISREVAMTAAIAFAVLALALALPGLVTLLFCAWADLRQRAKAKDSAAFLSRIPARPPVAEN
jgi:cell division protein FtsX